MKNALLSIVLGLALSLIALSFTMLAVYSDWGLGFALAPHFIAGMLYRDLHLKFFKD